MKTMTSLIRLARAVAILSVWVLGNSTVFASDSWRWQAVGRENSPAGRIDICTVWTGSEFLLWGGRTLGGNDDWRNDGFRYVPLTDNWKPISKDGAPEPRYLHTAIWTGRELIVWGGRRPTGRNGESYNTGARYNPVTDKWSPVSMTGAPQRRDSHSAIWTGKEMIVWGGYSEGHPDTWNDGGRYDPVSDSWKPLSTANAPYPRQNHAALWTGKEMIIWGGRRYLEAKKGSEARYSNYPQNYFYYPWEVSRYDPATDTWTKKVIDKTPRGRAHFAAAWTGEELIIWGGVTYRNREDNEEMVLNDGARFDPATESWKPIASANAPSSRERPIGLWTGKEMIVIGGSGEGNKGGRYNPALDSWTPIPVAGAPPNSFANAAAWTGEGLLVFQDQLSSYYETGLYAGDQIPDDWQGRFFGENNPAGAAAADPDKDGQDNLHEFLAGTNPTEANSRFSLRIEKDAKPPGSIKLAFSPRLEDRTYQVEVSTNLASDAFALMEGVKVQSLAATGSAVDLTTPDTARFYRIRISVP